MFADRDDGLVHNHTNNNNKVHGSIAPQDQLHFLRHFRQPLPPVHLGSTRSTIRASHSCPQLPAHQTFSRPPAETSNGVSFPFLVGCQSAASPGFATDSRTLQGPKCLLVWEEMGQPLPVAIASLITNHCYLAAAVPIYHYFLVLEARSPLMLEALFVFLFEAQGRAL